MRPEVRIELGKVKRKRKDVRKCYFWWPRLIAERVDDSVTGLQGMLWVTLGWTTVSELSTLRGSGTTETR